MRISFRRQTERIRDVPGPFVYARVETRCGYPALAQPDSAAAVVGELERTARRFDVEVLAYCVMPNHAHALLAGLTVPADPRTALRRWKQLTGQAHRLRTGATLWREKIAERVLVDPEEALAGVRYLAATPVIAGLVADARMYRWLGASRWRIEELSAPARIAVRPDWWPERVIAGCRSGYSPPRSGG